MFPLYTLYALALLQVLAAVEVAALTVDAGDEFTEPQARVLRAALKAVERVAIAYGTALAAQDTPLTLVVKAVTPLLR
ncbi:hypothetical protein ACFU96_41010 [Streptomyces sp. NPDC057620]|uniref:hypothetical protein n=1 Tax=Streptomyces sp. NPDC057620 TaxID=3346185 RepID=UPI0036769557